MAVADVNNKNLYLPFDPMDFNSACGHALHCVNAMPLDFLRYPAHLDILSQM